MSDKITIEISIDDIDSEINQVLLHNLLIWLYFAERLAKIDKNTFEVDVYETKGSEKTQIKKDRAL